jgi:hypothetical protein
MGNTRRLLIERLADKCDKYDAAIARQSVKSEEIQEAIEALKVCAWGNPDMSKQINLGIVALQAYQPWIPVDEKLPTEEGRYLVTFQERVIDVCWFSNGQFSIYGEKKTHLISSWKPLPEPPKGE